MAVWTSSQKKDEGGSHGPGRVPVRARGLPSLHGEDERHHGKVKVAYTEKCSSGSEVALMRFSPGKTSRFK